MTGKPFGFDAGAAGYVDHRVHAGTSARCIITGAAPATP